MAQVDEFDVLDADGLRKTVPSFKVAIERIGALTAPAAGSVNAQLASLVAKLSADPSTATLQTAGNTSLATIATDITALKTYVDGLETLLAATNSALSTINSTLGTVDGRVDGLEGLITTLNGYADGLETLIGTTNSTLTTLGGYMDGVEGGLTALQALVGEVAASPTAFTVLDRLKTISTSLTTLSGYVDQLEGYNDGLETLIGTTNTALTTIQGYVDGLETLIGTTNSSLTTLAGYLDGVEALLAAATPSGANYIGQVGGEIQIVSVTPTVSVSPAYSTGDCIGGKMTFANVVRANDVKALLQQVVIHCKSSQTIACDLLLFNADPSNSTFTDNAALAVNAADFDKLIGVVSLATTDWVNLGTPSIGQKDNIAKPFQPASGGTTIYAVLVARGTPTLGSTSDIKVTLKVI